MGVVFCLRRCDDSSQALCFFVAFRELFYELNMADILRFKVTPGDWMVRFTVRVVRRVFGADIRSRVSLVIDIDILSSVWINVDRPSERVFAGRLEKDCFHILCCFEMIAEQKARYLPTCWVPSVAKQAPFKDA